MTEWLLMDEVLKYLKVLGDMELMYRKKLEGLRKHGKIRSTQVMGIRYYDRASLDALREAKATGGVCAASHGSTDSGTKQETSSPITGTSTISTESAVAACLRGTQLARKTMRRTSRSPNSPLTGKNQSQESRIN